MPLRASVSNLETFRQWQEHPDDCEYCLLHKKGVVVDTAWLVRRLLGDEPPTEATLAGGAFHDGIEHTDLSEIDTLLAKLDVVADHRVVLA